MSKLLATGKTDLLDKFVSMRTRRAVQGLPGLGQGSGQGELRVRAAVQVPAAQGRCGQDAGGEGAGGEVRAGRQGGQGRRESRREEGAAAKKAAAPKAPRKTGPGLKPSAELAAVIGAEPVARTEVIKKLWDYIKANGLQDARTSARSTPTPSCSRCSASRR